MIIHDIYPSSKADPAVIREYGWEFIENIPTITNTAGRLAPTPERSELHRELRSRLEESSTVDYTTNSGDTVEIADFAISPSPLTPQVLGFFALNQLPDRVDS